MLTSSHDLHVLRIDTREDTLVRSSSEWVSNLVDDIHERVELKRNRERIVEIHHFIEHHRAEANEIEDQVCIDSVVYKLSLLTFSSSELYSPRPVSYTHLTLPTKRIV